MTQEFPNNLRVRLCFDFGRFAPTLATDNIRDEKVLKAVYNEFTSAITSEDLKAAFELSGTLNPHCQLGQTDPTANQPAPTKVHPIANLLVSKDFAPSHQDVIDFKQGHFLPTVERYFEQENLKLTKSDIKVLVIS